MGTYLKLCKLHVRRSKAVLLFPLLSALSHRDENRIQSILDLKRLKTWLSNNRLLLHLCKTLSVVLIPAQSML